MSLKSELTKTASYLRSARKAIIGRGGEISLTAGLKDLPEAIYSIPLDVSLAYQVDDSVAYQKVVPSNAEEYAQISKIGGMSYKTENLIPFPYSATSTTINGVTFTIQEDGGVKVQGTATASTTLRLVTNLALAENTFLTISGGVDDIIVNVRKKTADGSDLAFIESSSSSNQTGKLENGEIILFVGIYVRANLTVDATVYPMLNKGETPLPYSKYFEGLRETKVTKIESAGANLFNAKNIKSTAISVNEDGSKILMPLATSGNGNVTTNSKLSELCPTLKVGDVVSVRYSTDVPSGNSMIHLKGSEALWWDGNSKYTVTQEDLDSIVGLYGNRYINGYTEQVTLLDFRIVREPNIGFKPYVGAIETVEIPNAIRELDGYGEEYTELDFETKKFKNGGFTIELDGTEGWRPLETGNTELCRWYLDCSALLGKKQFVFVNNATVAEIVSNAYDAISNDDAWYNIEGISDKAIAIIIYDKGFTDGDVDAWKAYLAARKAAGVPIVVRCKLAEPIETDIAPYLTDYNNNKFIEVEGGGMVRFENAESANIPSTITYLIETAGV